MGARGRAWRTLLAASFSANVFARPNRLSAVLFLLAAPTALSGTAWAQSHLPTGGQVVGGSNNATISQPNENTLKVQQSAQSVIINWTSFNIAAGYTTKFQQPDGGVALNRIKS